MLSPNPPTTDEEFIIPSFRQDGSAGRWNIACGRHQPVTKKKYIYIYIQQGVVFSKNSGKEMALLHLAFIIGLFELEVLGGAASKRACLIANDTWGALMACGWRRNILGVLSVSYCIHVRNGFLIVPQIPLRTVYLHYPIRDVFSSTFGVNNRIRQDWWNYNQCTAVQSVLLKNHPSLRMHAFVSNV